MSAPTRDPVAVMAKMNSIAGTIGVSLRMEFASDGIHVWYGEQYPQDAGYPNARCPTIDVLVSYLKGRFERTVSEMEDSARRATVYAQQARQALAHL